MSTTTLTETMMAARIHSFGGPAELNYEETPTPEPGADEMLVRVHAAGVNPVDWKIREGRLGNIPFPAILGIDFSGTVEVLGSNVHDFHVAEEVFGEASPGSGTYCAIHARQAVPLRSETVSARSCPGGGIAGGIRHGLARPL